MTLVKPVYRSSKYAEAPGESFLSSAVTALATSPTTAGLYQTCGLPSST